MQSSYHIKLLKGIQLLLLTTYTGKPLSCKKVLTMAVLTAVFWLFLAAFVVRRHVLKDFHVVIHQVYLHLQANLLPCYVKPHRLQLLVKCVELIMPFPHASKEIFALTAQNIFLSYF